LREQPGTANLAACLQALASDYGLQAMAAVDLHLNLPDDCSPAPARIGHLLAIAKEALSNIARHARATRVSLAAEVEQDRLTLEIADNGRGLPVDYVVGYGLRNMRDRARLLGGEMQLNSPSGGGTQLRVQVPWCLEEEDDAKAAVSR
jgi:two-component system sensor histidine kinase UhpB